MAVPGDISFGEDVLWQVSRIDRPNAGSFLNPDNTEGTSQLLRVLAASDNLDDIARAKTRLFENSAFIEAQVRGGLIQSDIAKIVVSAQTPLPQSVEDWARHNGVQIVYGNQ